ncbi:hypothetical protein F4680DRAFT_470996 [Xylaria scruposa]|nr:hypothetical protein F4680DRAFT_470996 [Xylaria scruposa]
MGSRQYYGGQGYGGQGYDEQGYDEQNYGGQFPSQPYSEEESTSSYSMVTATQGPSQRYIHQQEGDSALRTVRVMEQLSLVDPLLRQYILDSRWRMPFQGFVFTLLELLAEKWFTREAPELADVHVTLEYDQEKGDVQVKIWVYSFNWGRINMMMQTFESHLVAQFNDKGREYGWDPVRLVWRVWVGARSDAEPNTVARDVLCLGPQPHWPPSEGKPLLKSVRRLPNAKLSLWVSHWVRSSPPEFSWLRSLYAQSMEEERDGKLIVHR